MGFGGIRNFLAKYQTVWDNKKNVWHFADLVLVSESTSKSAADGEFHKDRREINRI